MRSIRLFRIPFHVSPSDFTATRARTQGLCSLSNTHVMLKPTLIIQRAKVLAARRHIGYQTLLKEFVIERLYEEEKRAGLR